MRSTRFVKSLCGLVLVASAMSCGEEGGTTITVLDDAKDGFLLRKLYILSVEPAEGPLQGNQLVAMIGTGFEKDMTVTFGGKEALRLVVGGDELAILRTPAGELPGPVDIVATLADGRTSELPRAYTYVETDPAGTEMLVLNATPAQGKLAGGSLVVLEGRGFIDGANVFFGLVPATEVRVVGPEAITCLAPPGIATGTVDVRVETPETALRPRLQHTLVAGYTYLPDDPTVTKTLKVMGVVPPEGPVAGGSLVTVKGEAFAPGATVWFGTTRATEVEVLGDSAIICRTPQGFGPGRVPVRVELPAQGGAAGQANTLADAFLYYDDSAPLRVLTALPDHGPLGGGNVVTLDGQAFVEGATVYFGGAPATDVRVLAANVITCKAPPGVQAGRVNLRVELPGEGASQGDAYTLVSGYEYDEGFVDGDGLLVLGTYPASGPASGGNLVTVTGQGFTPGAVVYFAGSPATEITVHGQNAITCRAPFGAAAGPVDVRVQLPAGDAYTLPAGYTYLDPSQSDDLLVLQVVPADGPLSGNNVVAIAGQGFLPGSTVYFGGAPATDVRVLGATAITCRAPAGAAAGPVDIRVELPNGADAVTVDDGYTYYDDTTPEDVFRVLGVIPGKGGVSGGTPVTVTGQGFVAGARVYFGGVAATNVVVFGPNAISCTAPPGVAPGLVDLRIELPGPGHDVAGPAASLPNGFEYLDDAVVARPLLVLGAIPDEGSIVGGNVVTIAGQSFEQGAKVFFGGIQAADVRVLGDTALTCTAPAGLAAGLVPIRVELPGGDTHALDQAYRYLDDAVAPTSLLVFQAIPANGPLAGGNVVAIAGQGFVPGTLVYFGGTPATEVSVLGANTITVKAPASPVEGAVGIRVETPASGTRPGGAYTLPAGYTYDDAEPPPELAVLGVTPADGPLSGGTVTAVSGTGFVTGALVYFGAVVATDIRVLGPNAITCKTPPGAAAGLVDVRVELPGGLAKSLPSGFRYYDDATPPTPLLVLSAIPDSGPLGGGTTVTLSGQGFAAGARVFFDQAVATNVQVLAGTALVCTAPPAAEPGRADIRVELPDGASHTLFAGFDYQADVLEDDRLFVFRAIPDEGPLSGGSVVAISGQGFKAGATVWFGGAPATNVQVLAPTAIIAETPRGALPAGPVAIRVELPPVGQAAGPAYSLPDAYTYIDDTETPDALLLLSAIPSSGSIEGGQLVTVTGRGFVAGAEVWFGGTPASDVQVLAPEVIILRTPPGTAAGFVDLRIEQPAGASSIADTLERGFEYIDDRESPDRLLVVRAIPNAGPLSGGNVVALEGTGFTTGARVYFGGMPATDVSVLGPTAITCLAPRGAAPGLVDVRVELVGDGAPATTLTSGYRYVDDSDTTLRIAAIYPIEGDVVGGDLVLLTGSGFDPAMSVRFGGVPSPLVQVLGGSTATALTPPHVEGLVDVTIILPNTNQVTLPGGFVYIRDGVVDPDAVPALGGVLPSRGPTTGGTLVQLVGDNFAPGLTVDFGGAAASDVVVHTSTRASARAPAHAAGAVTVTVTNPNGERDALAGAFAYAAPTGAGPDVTSVWPSMGPTTGGTWVSVAGQRLADRSVVWFGNVAAQTTWVSATELVAIAPPGVIGSVAVTVVGPDGEHDTLAAAFAYYNPGSIASEPPVVGQAFPGVGSIAGGQSVSVIGSGFAPEARVYFDAARATVTGQTQSSVRIVTTPAHRAGSVRVTVVNPDGLFHSRADAFVYVSPPPLIRAVTPARASTAGGALVTVEGKNFASDSIVRFGDFTIASFVERTATQLRFFAPPSFPGFIDVAVENSDGQYDRIDDAFEYVADGELDDPQVLAVEPDHGPTVGGYIALVRGRNMSPDATVTFGDREVIAVEWLSNDLLKVVVPPGPPDTDVDVTVSNNALSYATLDQGFRYEATVLAPLSLRKVAPGIGPTTGGTVLTLEGAGFTDDTVVVVGNTVSPQVTLISDAMLTAVTPPGTPGLVNVSVSRPDLSQATAFNAFAYQRPETLGQGPRITAVSPGIGPMTGDALVLVEGSQFVGPAQVYFGANAAPVVHVLDTNRVVVRTPATTVSGSVAVAVINADGLVGVMPGGYAYYDASGVPRPEVFLAQPNSGSTFGNETIRILGDLFQPGARAYLCEIPAAVQSLQDDDTLFVTTPPNAPGACKITIVNPDGLTADRQNAFSYQAPPPVVTTVTPSAGPKEGGIDVVIQGASFVTGATVKFGNATSPQAIVVDPQTIAARLPANSPGVVAVTVVNPGAQQATGTKPDAFTYLNVVTGESPTIAQVLPGRGPTSGGTPVRILGAAFDQGALVILNGQNVGNVVVLTENEIRFTTPPAAAAGVVPLTILNPDGLGVTRANGFSYEQPATPPPEILGVVPGSGPEGGNTTLTITGKNFSAAGTWSMGGVPLSTAATVSSTLVTAKTPPHAPGKVDLLYVGPDGQVALKLQAYEYIAAPKVVAVTPELGSVAGGTEVTLVGDYFLAGMKVFFGANQGEVLFVSSSSTAVARTPPSLVRGFVKVTVRNGDGQEGSKLAAFEYLDPVDAQTVWPPQGPNTGGTLVQIRGTGMHPGTRVYFGVNEATEVYYESYNLVLAFVPAPTTSNVVDVKLVNPDGREDTLSAAFAYRQPSALGPKPFITGFFPPAGPSTGGTRVAIDGTDFHPQGQAIFVPSPAQTLGARANRVVVAAPPHPIGNAPLYWVDPDGWTVRAPSDFAYLDPASVGAEPSIREISPTRGPTAGNTAVAVRGTNYQPGARVRFGLDDAINVTNDPTELGVRTPPAAKGTVAVWMVNPDGTQAQSPDPYLYLPKPNIVTVSPTQGPASGGTDVTISGQDFMADPDGVKPDILFCNSFDDATGASVGCELAPPATIVAPSNGTQLFVKSPQHAPAQTVVVVVAPDGQRDVQPNAFRFTEVPQIADVVPDQGPSDGGQTVTITGTGFQFGAYVHFDGITCTDVNVRSATELTCKTPANAQGPADVTVRNLDGGFQTVTGQYTYVPRPLAEAIVPNLAPEEGGVLATITGKYFFKTADDEPEVWFGTTRVPEAQVDMLSSTSIRVTVPPGEGAVDIRVVNPDNQQGLLIDGFSYIPPLPPPQISYVVPTTGLTTGAESMRIVGANFLLAARAFVGKPDKDGDGTPNELGEDWTEMLNVEVRQNGTVIAADTPAYSDGVVDIMVLNSDGQMAVKTNGFTYVKPPSELSLAVLNIEPRRSVIQGGGYVTIGGTGFRAGITVRFGIGVGSEFSPEVTVLGPTLIRAKVPGAPNGVAGPVTIRVTNQPTPDKPLEAIDVPNIFEYVNGPVFARHPGDRLPNEDTRARGAIIFDANRDGANDVLVFRDDRDYLLVNNWQGAGWFSAQTFAPNAAADFNSDWAEPGDFDNDGWVDVIRMRSSDTDVQFCKNQGGTFPTCFRIYYNGQCRSEEAAVGDMNNDGKQDLVIAYSTVNNSACRTGILIGRGDTSFVYYNSFMPTETEPTRAIDLGDVDKDGDLDILLGHDSNNPTRLYLNNWKNLDAAGTCQRQIPDFTNKLNPANGKNYAYSNYTTNWNAARTHCQAYGYDLVQLDDQAEANFLRLDAAIVFPRNNVWIGHFDPNTSNTIEENVGTYSGGNTLLPVDRCGGEPNSQAEHCWVYDWNSGGTPSGASSCTSDQPCTSGYSFACEHPDSLTPCTGTWQFVNAQYGSGGQFPNVSGNVYDVKLIDIDKDTDLDAIVAVNQAAQQTKVLLNNGVGIFAADDGLRWPQNEQVRHERLHPVDIDFDGDIDIISRLSGFEVRIYVNQLLTPGVPGQAPAGFANETAVRWANASGKDTRTDVTGLAIGDLDDDDLPDVYIVGRERADRMVMNDGYEENFPWRDENRVGIGEFRFNTYRSLPERYYNGRDAAFGDFDKDGNIDIARCGYHELVTLWQNDGSGKYNELATATTFPGGKMTRCEFNGLEVVDINEDGYDDVLVEPYYAGGGDCPNSTSWTVCTIRELWINRGNGVGATPTFYNVTATNMPYAVSNYAVAMNYIDVDVDGDLDWLMGRTASDPARIFVNGGDVFNVGAPYGFEKTSEWFSGLASTENATRFVEIDINGDPWPDLYVTRGSSQQNRVWRNENGTRFTDVTVAYSNSIGDDSRDVLVNDFNGDGNDDLIVINNGVERYHSQENDGKYTDVTATSLPGVSDNSLSGAVGDFDRDGFDDFYVANYDTQNRMYLNLGTGRFQDLTANLPWDRHLSYQVLAWDFDEDCDLDIYVMNGPDQDRMYINTLDFGCTP